MGLGKGKSNADREGITEDKARQAKEVAIKAYRLFGAFQEIARDILAILDDYEGLRKYGREQGVGLTWAGFLAEVLGRDKRVYLLLSECVVIEWDIKAGRKYGVCRVSAASMESTLLLMGKSGIEEMLFDYTGKRWRFSVELGD